MMVCLNESSWFQKLFLYHPVVWTDFSLSRKCVRNDGKMMQQKWSRNACRSDGKWCANAGKCVRLAHLKSQIYQIWTQSQSFSIKLRAFPITFAITFTKDRATNARTNLCSTWRLSLHAARHFGSLLRVVASFVVTASYARRLRVWCCIMITVQTVLYVNTPDTPINDKPVA